MPAVADPEKVEFVALLARIRTEYDPSAAVEGTMTWTAAVRLEPGGIINEGGETVAAQPAGPIGRILNVLSVQPPELLLVTVIM